VKTQPAQKLHLSHSQVSEFLQCPRRYHLHRRLGLAPEFTPSALLFGSGVHAAIARLHQMRLEGQAATLSELLSAFLDRWEDERTPVRYRPAENEKALHRKAEQILKAYLQDPHCAGEPLAVEEPFRIPFGEDIPPVWGTIDLVESTPEGGLVLTDFKTAASRREPAPEQLILYREALKALDYPGAERATVRYVVLLKTKEPDVWATSPEIGPGAAQRLRRLYGAVWKDIESGCSHPKTGWWCAGCQWRRHCDQA